MTRLGLGVGQLTMTHRMNKRDPNWSGASSMQARLLRGRMQAMHACTYAEAHMRGMLWGEPAVTRRTQGKLTEAKMERGIQHAMM